ncbi:MAG: pyruvate kinase [Eubacteriales bacterium]|nr:pyruvate kinase [Eubacteriales bacterium]
MVEIYGTLGPKCADIEILGQMFRAGMTGIRVNMSHSSLEEAAPSLGLVRKAAENANAAYKLLIDMQGPELRTGKLIEDIALKEGDECVLAVCAANAADRGVITIPEEVMKAIRPGMQLLMDDGKLLIKILRHGSDNRAVGLIERGGILKSRKSIAVPEAEIKPPALTAEDIKNINAARKYGVYGIMQPFVRSRDDLLAVRKALDEAGASDVKVFAKIENRDGVKNLDTFMDAADEIIIARGDLGNSMPLWELPAVQKRISAKCREAGKPFMVVTQMLASMEKNAVPTRAEVSDIFNAVLDGASSVMITGETAAGEYPVEAVRYLANTVREAADFISEY